MKKYKFYTCLLLLLWMAWYPLRAGNGRTMDCQDRTWWLFSRLNKFQEAETAFLEDLEQDPLASCPLFGLRGLYLMRGDYEKAARIALQMCRIPGKNSFLPLIGADTLQLLKNEFRGYDALVEEELTNRLASPAKKGLRTSSIYKEILQDIFLRRGDRDDAERMMEALGYLTRWLVTGPFDSYERLAFYRPFAPERPGYAFLPVRASKQDEPGTTPYYSRDGTLYIPASVRGKGAFYFTTFVKIKEKSKYYFLVQSTTNLKLWVDHQPIVIMDHFNTFCGNNRVQGVVLKSGWHKICFKTISDGDSSTLAMIQFLREDGSPALDDKNAIFADMEGIPETKHQKIKLVSHPLSIEKWFSKYGKKKMNTDPLLPLSILARIEGNYYREREILDRYLQLHPDSAYAHYLSGLNYLYRSYSYLRPTTVRAKAKKELNSVLDLYPEAADALFELAGIKVQEGNTKEALEDLTKCSELRPGNSTFFGELFKLYYRKGWVREAREALEETLKLNPEALGTLYTAKHFYQEYGPREKHRDCIEEISRNNPFSVFLADYYLETGEDERALQEYRRLTAEDPFYLSARYEELVLLLENDRLEEAEDRLEEAFVWFPDHPALLELQARILMRRGARDAASETMEKILALDPENLEVRRWFTLEKGENLLFEYAVPADDLYARHFSSRDYPGADSILVLDNGVTLINPDGSAVRYYHLLTGVLTEEGVERESEIRISAGYELLKLRTIKPNGEILEPIDATGNVIQVPGLAPGDMVELEYFAFVPPSPMGKNGFSNNLYFAFQGANQPFVKSEYTLIHQKDMDVFVEQSNIDFTPEDTIAGPYRIRRWTVEESLPFEPEPFAPPAFTFVPYLRENYNQSWEDVVYLYLNAFIGKFTLSNEMKEKVDELTGRAENDTAKVKALFASVQNKISGNRHGLSIDRNALSIYLEGEGNRLILLKSFLDHAGIDATIVLTRSQLQKGAFLSCPDFQTFSYPILLVEPDDGSAIWLDLNESANQFGALNPLIQGSDGLLLKPGGEAEFVTLPHQPIENERNDLFYHLTFDEKGNLKAEVREVYSGTDASVLRSMFKNTSVAELGDNMEGYLNQYFPGVEMTSFNIENQEEEEGPLRIFFTFEGDAYARIDDGTMILSKIFRPLNFSGSFMSLQQRKLPLWIDTQLLYNYHVDIDFPPVQPVSIPMEPKLMQTEFGDYEISWEWKENRLSIQKYLWLPIQLIHPEQYAEFCKFGNVITEDDDFQFSVKLKE